MSPSPRKISLLLIVISFLLFACSANGESQPAVTFIPESITASSATPILSPTHTPQLTQTTTVPPTSTPADTATPAPSFTPTITPTVAPEEIVKIMTYNILNGGRGSIENLGSDEDRIPGIIEAIKAADPDIVGIQEASWWQLNDEAIAKEVAEALGMNYFIGLAGTYDGANVALLTKYEIINAEGYPNQFISTIGGRTVRGALHAELLTDTGVTLHVFVVHMKIMLPDWSEMDILIETAQPYQGEYTILMGDMNFIRSGPKSDRLKEAGYEYPLSDMLAIDQIWTSPSLSPYLRHSPAVPIELTSGTSDHFPVLRELWLFSPRQKE